MKIVISASMNLIALVVICLFVSRTSIRFHPFSFRMEKPMLGIGVFFLTLGLSLMLSQYYEDGKKKAKMEIRHEGNRN